MANIIRLTGTNGYIWINGNKILYMKRSDGETAIYCEGSLVAVYVREEPHEICNLLEGGNAS